MSVSLHITSAFNRTSSIDLSQQAGAAVLADQARGLDHTQNRVSTSMAHDV